MLACVILLSVIEIFLLYRLFHYLSLKVKSLTGIEQECYVNLGGRKQYMQIRGENVNNPIILFLHSGPGRPRSYLTYYFLKYLSDKYTLVYWEQTGSGKSFIPGDESITYEKLEEDLSLIVEYLCERFHKKQLVLMGHSSGTYLGVRYIKNHPERVEAFISVNQLIQAKEAIIRTTERVLNMYEKKERASAHCIFQLLKEMEDKKEVSVQSIKIYFQLRKKINAKLCSKCIVRKWKTAFLTLVSPDLTMKDIRWYLYSRFHFKGYLKIYEKAFREIAYADIVKEFGLEYKVPFYLIYGDRDYLTSSEMISEFYYQLSAPRKNLIEIINTGNKPHLENPKTFAQSVENILNELHNKR